MTFANFDGSPPASPTVSRSTPGRCALPGEAPLAQGPPTSGSFSLSLFWFSRLYRPDSSLKADRGGSRLGLGAAELRRFPLEVKQNWQNLELWG